METLSPRFVRQMFVASTVMMIISVTLSLFSVATVLSAPLRTQFAVPNVVGYEGYLIDPATSQPLGGSGGANYTITFRIHDAATGGTEKWNEQQTVNVKNGLFSVTLGSVTSFGTTVFDGDRWLGITVSGVNGGAEFTPRTRLTSVPFAINASHANDTDKVNGVAMSGMIAFFAATTCPTGWSEYALAQGRYIVGLPSGGAIATVGTALNPQEDRVVGQHIHSLNDPGHGHSLISYGTLNGWTGQFINGSPSGYGGSYVLLQAGSNTTGITVNPAGSVAGTNAPYVQLKACQVP